MMFHYQRRCDRCTRYQVHLVSRRPNLTSPDRHYTRVRWLPGTTETNLDTTVFSGAVNMVGMRYTEIIDVPSAIVHTKDPR